MSGGKKEEKNQAVQYVSIVGDPVDYIPPRLFHELLTRTVRWVLNTKKQPQNCTGSKNQSWPSTRALDTLDMARARAPVPSMIPPENEVLMEEMVIYAQKIDLQGMMQEYLRR